MTENRVEQVQSNAHGCERASLSKIPAGKLEALMKELGGMDISEMKPFAGFSEDGKN